MKAQASRKASDFAKASTDRSPGRLVLIARVSIRPSLVGSYGGQAENKKKDGLPDVAKGVDGLCGLMAAVNKTVLPGIQSPLKVIREKLEQFKALKLKR